MFTLLEAFVDFQEVLYPGHGQCIQRIVVNPTSMYCIWEVGGNPENIIRDF